MKRILSLMLVVLMGTACAFAALPAGLTVCAEEPASYIPSPTDLTARADFGFGINMHPKSYEAYPEVYLEEQVHAIARMGSEWVRVGGAIPSDGDWTYLDTLVGLCNKYGLKIIMVISPDTTISLEYITIYCETFAYRYNGSDGRGYVDIFQVFNELDLPLLKAKYGGASPDGKSETEYYTIPVDGAADLPEYLEYLEAAEKGIHSKNSKSQFMVNFSMTHYGMIKYYLNKGLKIDVVGWDLYSSNADREISAAKLTELYNAMEEDFYNKYKLPVILCETNVNSRSLDATERAEAPLEPYMRLIDTLYLAYARPWVKGAIVYELLDEPAFKSENPESWYGMFKNPGAGGKGITDPNNEKPIYKLIQSLIGGNENMPVIKRSAVNLKPYEKLTVNTADDSGIGNTDNNGNAEDITVPDIIWHTDDTETDDVIDGTEADDPYETAADDAHSAQVREIKTRETLYEMPWLVIALSGAGILAAGAAVVAVYLIVLKKKLKKTE